MIHMTKILLAQPTKASDFALRKNFSMDTLFRYSLDP